MFDMTSKTGLCIHMHFHILEIKLFIELYVRKNTGQRYFYYSILWSFYLSLAFKPSTVIARECFYCSHDITILYLPLIVPLIVCSIEAFMFKGASYV